MILSHSEKCSNKPEGSGFIFFANLRSCERLEVTTRTNVFLLLVFYHKLLHFPLLKFFKYSRSLILKLLREMVV